MSAPIPTPVSAAARAVAPDLARGTLLLFIAIANAPYYLLGRPTGLASAHPVGATGWDLVAQSISIVAIDGRSYPMFAFLFGYGIWQLYRRQLAAGVDSALAKRLLRRRHAWMVAFGAVHALLLWMGDVVGTYGLVGLIVAALFLDGRDLVAKITAASLAGVVLLSGLGALALGLLLPAVLPPGALALPGGDFDFLRIAQTQENYLVAAAIRLGMWVLVTGGQVLGLVIPIAVLLALVAARAGVLEEPEKHLPLLRRTAIGGIAIAWTFGAVAALQNAGLLLPREFDWWWTGLNLLAGLCGGLGYVAVFGLVAARVRHRPAGIVRRSIQALGARSLSGYLAQSVVFAPLMSAWGFGLGFALSSWSIALVAIATWALTVVLAAVLDRVGKRGPAEWLLRRLAYR